MNAPIRIPTFADIQAAAGRIAGQAVVTPLLEYPALNARLGRRVLLKPEIFQRTGSFKFRGAYNRISIIPESERGKGVVAFSSGNHAQGVAAAAALFKIPATIVMPIDAPRSKIDGTKSYGAKVNFYDRRKEDREAIAAKLLAETGGTLVRPFDDPDIVAGQGTAGMEMVQQAKALGVMLDRVFVPCGGGGVTAGVALAFAALSPQTKVVPVEPTDYDGMGRSLRAGERTAAPGKAASIADSLQAPMPGVAPFGAAKALLSDALVVGDTELSRAVSLAFRMLKLVVEPGGAAGLAGALETAGQTSDSAIGILLSGGNADPETIMQCCAAVPLP
jgi:threonine dehydratase